MSYFVFFLTTIFAISSFTTNLWKPSGLMDDSTRKQHLVTEFQKNIRKNPELETKIGQYLAGRISEKTVNEACLTRGIHTVLLPDYGRAFNFDGTIDIDFCNELLIRKDQNITILIPAFGIGRSIMDVLSIHPNAEIIANDLQNTINYLTNLLTDYNFSEEKITYLMGDITEKIKELENDSLDLIYLANLIHFLSPFKLRNLLCEFNRVLKPQGKLFISWRRLSCPKFNDLSNKLDNWKIPYPRYIDEDYFDSINDETIILPYYAASTDDVKNHSEKAQFAVIKSGLEYSTGVALWKDDKYFSIGEYKFDQQPTFGNSANAFIILKKQNNGEIPKKIENNEQTYFNKRKNLIMKYKKNNKS